MIVKKFEQITTSHPKDSSFGDNWSRPYEYATAIQEMEKLNPTTVHNACWGFEGCHILFKNELEKIYGTQNVLNSDMIESAVPNTQVWNAFNPPRPEWYDCFDVALCISTLEEVENFRGAWDIPGGKFQRQMWVLQRISQTVKPGGHIILTFDYPGLELTQFEAHFKEEFKYNKDIAVLSEGRHTFSCGLLILQK